MNRPSEQAAAFAQGAPAVARSSVVNRRRARRGLVVAGAIALVLLGLIMLLLIGLLVGPAAFLTGLVLAALPVPVYVSLALWVDRYEPEPRPVLAWAFFWGATGATVISLILNTGGQALVGSTFGQDLGEIYGGSVSAPGVEESAKAAALFGIYRWRRSELDGVLDGIVYAAMVGLGFATTENVLYYGSTAAEEQVPVEAVFFLRGVISPFAHPVFTAMTGIGLALAATGKTRTRRIIAPALGVVGAILLHSAWNTSAGVDGAAFLGVYLLLMVPVFFALVLVSLVALRRDGRRVRAYLEPEVQTGLITADDLAALSSLRRRRRALRAAREGGGGAARRARKAFHAAATDLAFHRHRSALGRHAREPPPPEDEASYVERLRELRSQLSSKGVRPGAPVGAGGTPPSVAAPAAPANWYPDPSGQARLRYWDGFAWTGHTAD